MATMTMTYTDPQQFAADYEGRIQIDRSGVGHCWVTVHPDDLRGEVLAALADEDGEIVAGATATVGGMHYRAA